MTSEELAAAAAHFGATLPMPDEAELRAQLAQPILHDLVKVLKRCCPDQHPLTSAKKAACMFFMAAVTDGAAHLELLKLYDGMTDERRATILSAWEGALAAMEAELQPRFQYMAILRHADGASGARTFDRAVVAFDGFARTLLTLDGRTEDDGREMARDVHYELYAQPDDMACFEAVMAERLPDWFQSASCDQPGFHFLQYFHRTSGAQLDVNVGTHVFIILGGPSGGPYDGAGWRDPMATDLVAAARKVSAES